MKERHHGELRSAQEIIAFDAIPATGELPVIGNKYPPAISINLYENVILPCPVTVTVHEYDDDLVNFQSPCSGFYVKTIIVASTLSHYRVSRYLKLK